MRELVRVAKDLIDIFVAKHGAPHGHAKFVICGHTASLSHVSEGERGRELRPVGWFGLLEHLKRRARRTAHV